MGVRRSGKSVLARLALADRDYAYVNFDDERLSALTTRDLQRVERMLAAHWPSARILFMDEVQNVASSRCAQRSTRPRPCHASTVRSTRRPRRRAAATS
jgi:predicted AAA+ superfamily ATPase